MGDNYMKNTVCQPDMCSGCMACLDVCKVDAIRIVDSLKAYNAIKTEGCIECGACQKVCQQNNPPIANSSTSWYQGWAKNDDIRRSASSGGYASAISKAFILHDGYVCSCVFKDGIFGFEIINDVNSLNLFAGSKYVKSNPIGIYSKIKTLLRDGKSLLFIGLPCQVAALKKYLGTKLQLNLYTIDLICHGTPSPKLLDHFLNQYNLSLSDLKSIQFRSKKDYSPKQTDCLSFVPMGSVDYYSVSFLHSLTYTNNCYSCHYAKKERVSELTLGDSWGTSIEEDSIHKGVSLVLCQNDKGKYLLNIADLELKPVDFQIAVSKNSQLRHPSLRPQAWYNFFSRLEKGKSFNSSVVVALKGACVRQFIKRVCVVLRIKQLSGILYSISIIQKNKIQ